MNSSRKIERQKKGQKLERSGPGQGGHSPSPKHGLVWDACYREITVLTSPGQTLAFPHPSQLVQAQPEIIDAAEMLLLPAFFLPILMFYWTSNEVIHAQAEC